MNPLDPSDAPLGEGGRMRFKLVGTIGQRKSVRLRVRESAIEWLKVTESDSE